MSSLAGFAGFDDSPVNPELVDSSVSVQSRRDTRCFRLALGEAVFGADVPGAIAADDHLIVVVDARLDNRRDLRTSLDLPPDASDASLVLAGWRAWGDGLPDRMLGDFAVAIFSRRERALWLFADPSSERPLHYVRSAEGIFFSSIVAGLRPLVGTLDPDLEAIAASVSGALLNGRTNFTDVKRVLPGEIVRLDAGGRKRWHYWRPPLWPRARCSAADRAEEYRHLLRLAVECRLEPGTVATQLSSGWDSSAVTAMASRVAGPERIVSFTSAPLNPIAGSVIRGRFVDESPVAARTAQSLGIDHVIVRQTPKPFEVARKLAAQSHYLVNCPFNMAWWDEIRAGALQKGAKCLLTGELGNLTLNAGGIRTLRAHAHDGHVWKWLQEARACVSSGSVRWRGVGFASLEPLIPVPVGRMLRQGFGVRNSSADFLRPEWRRPDEAAHVPFSPYRERFESILDTNTGEFRRSAMSEYGIMESDPTSDRRIMEFSLSLPPEDLLSGGQSRPLARLALTGLVPQQVLNLQQRGLQGADWYQRVSKRDALEALEDMRPNTAVANLIDLKAVEKAISDWPGHDWNSEQNYGRYRISLTRAICAGIFLKEVSKAS